jgi:hypothetical protein
MKVVELENLQREEGEIFYLRKYHCTALIEFPTTTEEVPIFFSIETNPLGQKTIDLSVIKPLNYPLLPVKKALINFIFTEELEGRLPC